MERNMSYLHKPFPSISFIFGLYLFAGSTQASVGWIFENEQLTGATGVEISGSLYNVSFIDDSCINAFDGCDSVDDFTFKTQDDALVAANALLDQVLLDANSSMLLLDSDPETTFGCVQLFTCIIIVPHDTDVAANSMSGIFTTNRAANFSVDEAVPGGGLFRDQNTETNGETFVYAKFTSAQPVPVPAAAWLFGSALLGFAGISKRKRT